MLNLWSDQHPEFTFRVWDVLVYSASLNDNRVKNLIPYIALTYLKHTETHGEIEVINFNLFITNLFKNKNSLNLSDMNEINEIKKQNYAKLN